MKTYCDMCGYQIENEDAVCVPIYLLKFPCQDAYLFCCDECRDNFIKEHFLEGYLYNNGHIELDN